MQKPLPQRKSPRLTGYDYAQSGAYFVTICTHQRVHLFGEVVDSEMILNLAGEIAREQWLAIAEHRPNIALDSFVVMPNHVHGIVVLVGTTQTDEASLVPTLGAVIGGYKSAATRLIREKLNEPGLNVWQGRYHDHIIRSQHDFDRLCEYVSYNPARWTEDTFFASPVEPD